MRYSCNVISRTLRSLAIAVPLSLAVGIPAASAATYSPGVNAIQILGCDWENVDLSVDGAVPGSAVTGTVTFFYKAGGSSVVNINETATGSSGELGSATWSKSVAIPGGVSSLSASITAELVSNVGETQTKSLDRVSDCGLPETGSNSAPIGKIALGTTLGGALLAAVAIRRRPRKTSAAA